MAQKWIPKISHLKWKSDINIYFTSSTQYMKVINFVSENNNFLNICFSKIETILKTTYLLSLNEKYLLGVVNTIGGKIVEWYTDPI